MAETFLWRVTSEAAGAGEFNVDVAAFGDNYAQEAPRGINNELQTWNVTYVGYKIDAEAVLDFIRQHKGATSFNWKAPLTGMILVKCKRWGANDQGGGLWAVTMEFKQSYQP